MTATNNDKALVPTVEAGVLNAVAQGCWQTSDDHGFHEDWQMADWLEKLANDLAIYDADQTETEAVIADYQAEGFPVTVGLSIAEALHVVAITLRTNVLGMKIALIHSEMSEALEALRDLGANGLLDANVGDPARIANFGEELADAKIRIDDLSGIARVAIGDLQMAKMAVNEGRPHKHGRKV